MNCTNSRDQELDNPPVVYSPDPLNIVIPIYELTARNAPLLIKRFRKTTSSHALKFYFVCDSYDPSFEWLRQLTARHDESVNLIATQSYVNENAFISTIDKYTQIDSSRHKWYWQQFKKLLAFQIPDIGERIVLWDSDTFPARTQVFFNGTTPLCEPSNTEYHVPYFITFANLTGHLILPPNSSITQFAAVWAWELNHLARIFAFGLNESNPADKDHAISFDSQIIYFDRIFKSLAYCEASNSLFADYEYINLYRLLCRHPFLILKRRHFRYGGWLPIPKLLAIKLLSLLSFSNVSFERYHPFEKARIMIYPKPWLA